MAEQTQSTQLRDRIYELGKAVGLVALSVFISISAYVWRSTVERLEADITYNRRYLEQLSERIRTVELTAAANQSLSIGFSQRLDRLEQLNYGYRARP